MNSPRIKSICLFTMSFLTLSAEASAAPLNRFELATQALNEVRNDCTDEDICVLVNLNYSPILNSRYENKKHFGSLDSRARITMIKTNALTPWLALTPELNNLRRIEAPLFPRRGGLTKENGFIPDYLFGSKHSIHEAPVSLRVNLEFQTNIYKEAAIMEVGSITLPQMPTEHEIFADNPNKNNNPYSDSYTIGLILPLKLKNNIQISTTMKMKDILKTYKTVSVPNSQAKNKDEEGIPYITDYITFSSKKPVYQMQFQDLNQRENIITSLETADIL